jgi:hypothetical protein
MGSAKIKVIKSENYTVISNIACRDKRLSMKALGVHTFMMQLPDNWDYSLAGLAKCHADGIDAIRSAINELIKYGYVYRFRAKDEKGLFTDSEYLVFESPECNEYYQQELKKPLKQLIFIQDWKIQCWIIQRWKNQYWKNLRWKIQCK